MSATGIAASEVRTFSKVSFEGLEAYTDAYAIEGDSFKFLSLFGSRVSVRAIWSALLSGAPVSLDDSPCRMDGADSWQVFQRILPSGALHAVCYPCLADLAKIQNEFIVLGETKDEITKRFYLYLDRISETPVSPEWSEWILAEALDTGKAAWLKGLHFSAVAYRHDEPWLENLITGYLAKRKKLEV
jgi:hypothetical protein